MVEQIEKGLGLTYSKKGNARRLADKCSSLVDQIWASLSLIPLYAIMRLEQVIAGVAVSGVAAVQLVSVLTVAAVTCGVCSITLRWRSKSPLPH